MEVVVEVAQVVVAAVELQGIMELLAMGVAVAVEKVEA